VGAVAVEVSPSPKNHNDVKVPVVLFVKRTLLRAHRTLGPPPQLAVGLRTTSRVELTSESMQPRLSVTTSFRIKVELAMYVCAIEAAADVLVTPSPKDQRYLLMGMPGTSVERSVKFTTSGAQPESGVKLNESTGFATSTGKVNVSIQPLLSVSCSIIE